ncbi:MAG: prephenate dehydratase domain-containing protein, partial [Nitrosomonadales bacterium]|nr:prephenate dehydratase domain-containing protein [Nitrosomonadales bacterium]
TNASICGEVALPVHHNLLSQQTDLIRVNKLYSHAQSLSQCHEWLNQNLPGVERHAVASNAEAAKLAMQEPHAAAIASRRAGELFKLNLIAQNIEDDPKNTTRFLVLSSHDVAPSGKDKTSLVMAAKNVPGAVVDLLEPLAKHQVSMTKFESRPSKMGIWEYVFFVDIEGHQLDGNVAAAMAELQKRASLLKVLGSYPVAVI